MIIDFIIVDFIGGTLAGLFLWLIGLLGRFVVRIASFGTVRAAPPDVPYPEFNWFCYRRSEDGWIEVESTVAEWIGIFICFSGLAVFLHTGI